MLTKPLQLIADSHGMVMGRRGQAHRPDGSRGSQPKTLRGFLKGSVKITAEIVGRIDVAWDAEAP